MKGNFSVITFVWYYFNFRLHAMFRWSDVAAMLLWLVFGVVFDHSSAFHIFSLHSVFLEMTFQYKSHKESSFISSGPKGDIVSL